MTHRWKRPPKVLRTIRCAVVEVPAMSDPIDPRPSDGFAELVPWADPYIAALIEKLRRTADCGGRDAAPADESFPPPGSPDAESDEGWPGDWRRRNWPGE